MKKFILPIIALLTMGAGCATSTSVNTNTQTTTTPPVPPTSTENQQPVTTSQNVTPTPQKLETTITYFIPTTTSVDTKYCNGADMDSVGYKKTLTKKVTKVVPGVFSTEDMIKETLILAAKDPSADYDPNITRIAAATFKNGVVTLRPASGHAGTSIFLCAWQPFAEKQLSQFKEVKQIKWESQS